MQKPPHWCPWASTDGSDLDSFSSARNRFCHSAATIHPLSLKIRLKERLDEEEDFERGESPTLCNSNRMNHEVLSYREELPGHCSIGKKLSVQMSTFNV